MYHRLTQRQPATRDRGEQWLLEQDTHWWLYYCWLGPPPRPQAALPVLDARRQDRLAILVVRFFPLPARTIAVTFTPVGDQSSALATNQAVGFLLRTGTPSHPGRYRVSVAARWPGRGEIGSDFFLNVK